MQQPADAAVARAVGHARVPRLALAREAGRRTARVAEHRLRQLAGSARRLGAQLSRLRGVRHRSVHLLRQGGAGRRAGAQHRRVREGQGGGVLAARAAARHVARRRSSRPPARPACMSSCRSSARSTSTPRARCRELVGRHLMRQHPKDITHGVERHEAHRQDLHGLQHERARQDPQRGLLAARRARRAGVDAADLGRAREGASARFRLYNVVDRLHRGGDRGKMRSFASTAWRRSSSRPRLERTWRKRLPAALGVWHAQGYIPIPNGHRGTTWLLDPSRR